MNNVLIIDDEQACIDLLKNHINAYADYKIIGEAKTLKDALEISREQSPDIVFLDINLGSTSGFEYLVHHKDNDLCVVITTAYSEHMMRAIKLSALGFLLKPFTKKEFREVIHKFETDSKRFHNKRIEALLNNLRKPAHMKMDIPVRDGTLYVKLEDIIRCHAHYNQTDIYLISGQSYSVNKKLKSYEDELSPLGFFRTHRAHLVNLHHVVKYFNSGYAEMEDGSTVEVATRKKTEFLKRLGLD